MARPAQSFVQTQSRGHGIRVCAVMLIAGAIGWAGVALAANPAAKKDDSGLDIDAPTAILIEARSGSVLYEKNADQLTPPSSMLKLMTAEIVLDALKSGRIKSGDQYLVSENSWRRGGAPAGGPTMFAAIHSRIAVNDLLSGMLIQNGNDAAMVLAEGIAGNERAFAERMTKRAREIGLAQSTFANSTGLTDAGNRMSVREIGRLARHLVQNYPDAIKTYGEREFTWNKIRQMNRNPLLAAMTSADGLVAGSTKDGGYGLAGSAVQDGVRLIVVVNGLEDPDDRVAEAKRLLEWGFRNFELRTLFEAQRPVGSARVFGGDSRSVELASREPVRVMVHKNGSDKLLARIVYRGPVAAPIAPGQQVGAVRVWRGSSVAVETPLYAAEAVGPGSTWRRAIDGASEAVIGLFRSGAEKL